MHTQIICIIFAVNKSADILYNLKTLSHLCDKSAYIFVCIHGRKGVLADLLTYSTVQLHVHRFVGQACMDYE